MNNLSRKIIYLLLLLTLTGLLYGCFKNNIFSKFIENFSSCPHLPQGIPTGTPETNHFICRDIYALSANTNTKMADFVAYCLDKNMLSGKDKQNRNWQADPDLNPEDTLEPEDYQGVSQLGYDRGHQAPLANFRGGNWQETNYLSNITPQNGILNKGAWEKLERHERDIVRQYHRACIITGPYYLNTKSPPKLLNADEPHRIPSGYWKIISYDGKREYYQFPQNTPKNTDFNEGATSLDKIEKLTNLKLFP